MLVFLTKINMGNKFRRWIRVGHGSVLLNSIQPNPQNVLAQSHSIHDECLTVCVATCIQYNPSVFPAVKHCHLQITMQLQSFLSARRYASAGNTLCPPKKTCDYIFYNNFNNRCPITIIFGIVSSKSMSHRKMVSFPTSPNQCNYLTLGNHRTQKMTNFAVCNILFCE